MKKLLLLPMLVLSVFSFSQTWTYNVSYSADAGNPGGLNTEGETSAVGWTTIQGGAQSADVWSPVTPLPFAFDFYGTPVTQFKASQTGLLTFDATATLPSVPNETLPSANLPNTTICAFWDEFTAAPPTGTNDEIRTKVFGTAPNRQLWVRWFSFEMGNPTVSFSYFAVVLEESTNNIYMVDQYGTTAGTLSGTVGVQLDPTVATQFGITNTLGLSGNGTAITDNDFYTFAPELLVDNNAGVLSLDNPNPLLPLPTGTQNIDVTVRNYGVNDLTSFNVEWEINGVAQTALTYSTPTIPVASNSASLNLGTYNFPLGFTELKFWTTNPNGLPDAQPSNDTLLVTLCTALGGTYSIGGASPDFATIGEANTALLSCGVSAPVVFNIAPGVYNESITTGDIFGTSATNTVTFDGGSATTTSIVANAPAVIALDGADYVTWKNVTIENTATTDGFGFHLGNASDFNTIDSCIITLDPTATFDVIGIVCSDDVNNDFAEGNSANFCTFSNNVISGGEMGIHMEGPTANGQWTTSNSILNNEIHTMDDYGIYMDNQDSITISGNKIFDNRSVQGDGIYCFDIANFDISYNEVYSPDWGIYITDGNFDFPVASQSLLINNMVKSETDYAIYFDDVNNVNMFHNTSYGNPGIRMNDFNTMDIRNNIFVSDNDYAFEVDDSITGSAGNIVNHNLYWTPNTNGLFVLDGAGTTYANLAGWQGAQPTLNVASVQLEPVFAGIEDLHVTGAVANDVGDNTVGVLDDIDGDTRPLAPSTVVDMGADEFTPPADDAGVLSLDNPNPLMPLVAGAQNVEVTVRNYGADPLSTFFVNWEANGVPQTALPYISPTIPVLNNSASLNLGSYNFPLGFTDLKFWTSSPNGSPDQNTSNDTLEVTLCTPLSGTYAVGGATPDFATVSEAASALSTCGINGPVVFNIAPGVYNEAVQISPIGGTSATNTITFDGGSAATTSIVSDQLAVIAMSGAERITWKNLTIENTATTDGFGFHLGNASDFNTIDSCIIILDPTATLDVIGIVCSGDVNNDFAEDNSANFCTFSNNIISGGEMGIHMEGPNATGQWTMNNSILNNEIHTVDDYGIYLDNQDSITVSGNQIFDLRNAQGDGIYCSDIANFDISYNEVYAPDWGIYIPDGNFDFTVATQSSMINNMVKSETDYAIYLDDVNNVNIFHNTAYGNPGIRINDFDSLNIRNNIFISNNDYAYESDEAVTASNSVVDFNIYWTPATNALFVRDGAFYTDLALWQTAEPTLNVASLEAEPFFVGAEDLHIVGPTANDIGDNTVGVLDDIDGDTRPIAPSTVVDIGADEYTPIADDATAVEIFLGGIAPCGDSLTEVFLVFQNLGSDTITSLTASADVTGIVTTTLNGSYTGSIAFTEVDTISLGTINTYTGGTIDITGWTILTGDGNTSNDTLSASFLITPFEPIGINGFGCGADSALISGAPGFPVLYEWYDAPTGGNLVGVGSSYMIPSIATQNTYYLAYGQGVADSLVTTYAAGNGCGGGAMFNVESVGGSALFGLRVHSSLPAGSAVPVNVYYIVGSGFSGNEANAAAWTSAGSYTVTSGGTGNGSSELTLNTPLVLPAGTTVAIYVEYNAQYTNGTNSFTTGDITVSTGTGLCGSFSGLNIGRMFNGTLFFGGDPCSAIRTPVSAQQVPAPTVTLGADTTICGLDFTLNAVGSVDPQTTWIWSDGATTQTNTVTNSDTYWVEVADSNGCTVTDSVDVFISGLEIDSLVPVIEFCLGDSAVLVPTVSSNHPYTFTWSSGDTTEQITVTSTDIYTFTVTDSLGCTSTESTDVTAIEDPVAGFTDVLNADILTVTSSATNADSTVYDFGDGTTVTGVNETHTYTANGTYTVCQYVYNDCGADTLCRTIVVSEVGLIEISADNVTLHPNPTDAVINITLDNASAKGVTILTAEGRLVETHDLSGTSWTLDVSSYPDGVYFVNIESTSGTIVKKFIKE